MNLDSPETFRKVDRSDMLGLTLAMPQEIREAVEIGRGVQIPQGYGRCSQVLVMGMGGSGIPGDNLRALLWGELPVPLLVSRTYTIPRCVGRDTLAFAVSYSGDTEETLAAFDMARGVGARLVSVTSGGRLLSLSQELGIPCLRVPGGRQTRASFGYLLFPLLVVLQRLGLIADKAKDVEEAIRVVEEMARELGPAVPVARNAAKSLALKLSGKFVLLLGTYPYSDVVALRWKQQLNENSKMLARYEFFPELNHNEIVAWDLLGKGGGNVVLLLRDGGEPPQMRKRIEVTREFLVARGVGLDEVWSRGQSLIARLLSLSYFSNFVSIYLALLSDVDPTPVETIAHFKKKLAS